MNRPETIEMLRFCKGIWPEFYKGKGKEEHNAMIDEWASYFHLIAQRHVKTAIYCLADMKVHPTKEEIEAKINDLFPVSHKAETKGYFPEEMTKEVEKCIL